MRIVVLDGHAANPGDLSWQALEKLGDCTVYPRTPPAETVARAKGAGILLTNKTVLDGAVLAQLPDCRYIGVLATGYNVVDLAAARDRGIAVTNVPAYSTASVAQTVFAHILNLTQHVAEHSDHVRRGKWCKAEDFCYWDFPLMELAGKHMGIVGFGKIGRAVAKIARAFDMQVLVSTRTPVEPAPEGIQFVDLDTLFRESDVLSLHCPLTEETRHLVNAKRLALMKPAAFVVNASRGPVVDAAALAAALNDGRIAGAGVDVMDAEPPAPDDPLLTAANCYFTPHIAWATREARSRLLAVAIENVAAFLRGAPQNVVS